MKIRKKFSAAVQFIALLSGCLWLGAYSARMFIGYGFFDNKLNVLDFINNQNMEAVLISITPVINATFILYIVFIFTFTIFMWLSKINLKMNGWFFITVLIVYLTLPFEAYLMTIDFEIIHQMNFSESINSDYVLGLIKSRFEKLNGFPIIITLSYCSILYLLLFKPFSLTVRNED